MSEAVTSNGSDIHNKENKNDSSGNNSNGIINKGYTSEEVAAGDSSSSNSGSNNNNSINNNNIAEAVNSGGSNIHNEESKNGSNGNNSNGIINSSSNNKNNKNNHNSNNCNKNNSNNRRTITSRIFGSIAPPPNTAKCDRPPRRDDLRQHNIMKRNMSIAKGFMDVSLFGANANQLRILISFGDKNEYTYYIIFTCLLFSLIVQLISGITLIVKEKFDLEDEWSDYLNNVIVIQVFFIVLINVFLSGFGINLMSKEQLVLIKIMENQTLDVFNKTLYS